MRIAPKNICLLILTALVSGSLNAQTPPPPPTPIGPGFPIDGNLFILGVVGIVFAAYFFKKRKSTVK